MPPSLHQRRIDAVCNSLVHCALFLVISSASREQRASLVSLSTSTAEFMDIVEGSHGACVDASLVPTLFQTEFSMPFHVLPSDISSLLPVSLERMLLLSDPELPASMTYPSVLSTRLR